MVVTPFTKYSPVALPIAFSVDDLRQLNGYHSICLHGFIRSETQFFFRIIAYWFSSLHVRPVKSSCKKLPHCAQAASFPLGRCYFLHVLCQQEQNKSIHMNTQTTRARNVRCCWDNVVLLKQVCHTSRHPILKSIL